MVCETAQIPAESASAEEVTPPLLPAGRYDATQTQDSRLSHIDIEDGRVNLLGVWLDLISRADGSYRVANSNSKLLIQHAGVEGPPDEQVPQARVAIELHSARFGRVTFAAHV